MKTKPQILIALLIVICFAGCATITGDPVLVNAEKTTAIAADAIDTFLKIEYDNQVTIKQNAPAIHQYANYVRKNAPQWLASARALTKAYETNRTSQGKFDLDTAIAVLTAAQVQSQIYIAKIAPTPTH